MNIRNATPGDVGAICNIYNYYVEHTAVTFETIPVSESEMKNRMSEVIESGHSFYVGEAGGKIIGYYYTHRWNNRCAYSTTVEESIYLDKDERGKGYGTQLFQHLLGHIDQNEVHVLIAGISIPNEDSVRLHEKFGFTQISCMYANAAGIVPVIEVFVAKGVPIGTALAFMMAVVGLSFPEATLLKKVMNWRLIGIFFGLITLFIIILGYLFNMVL